MFTPISLHWFQCYLVSIMWYQVIKFDAIGRFYLKKRVMYISHISDSELTILEVSIENGKDTCKEQLVFPN